MGHNFVNFPVASIRLQAYNEGIIKERAIMTTTIFDQLPKEVQDQILLTLTAYTKAYATLENGEFTYTAGLSLDTRIKAADFKTFEFKNTDFYSQEQITAFNKLIPDLNW